MSRGLPESGSVRRAAAFRAGNFAEVCRQAEQAPPESVEDRVIHGRSLLGLGRAADALSVLRAARAVDDADHAVRYFTACALVRLGCWREAEAELDDLVAQPTWSTRTRATRAQVRVRAGAWLEAAADYEALAGAGELAPRDRLGWAACLVQLGRWGEAQTLLEGVVAGGSPPELAWWLLGRCREGQGDWNAAADVYRRGLERFPFSDALGARLLAAARRPSARRADALLRALTGRQRLLDDWTRRQAICPSNLELAHRIALLTSYWAGGLPVSFREKARPIWRIALGNWAIVLEDGRWADRFIERRAAVYGQTVTNAERSQFETGLEAQVERLLSAAHGDQPQLAEPTVRDMFLRERYTCRTLREVGGLGRDADGPFAVGPDQARRLGLLGGLKPFLRRIETAWPSAAEVSWTSWPDPDGWHEPPRRLRLLFSALGYAQVRLERGDPEGVLDALRWAICPACLAALGPAAGTAETVAVCRADCPELAARNPGFADLVEPRSALLCAGGWLYLQALVAALRRELNRPEPDATVLGERWRAARAVASAGPRGETLRDHLVRATLEATRQLGGDERFEAAVRVLEEAIRCEPGEPALGGALADALTNWGIDLANGGSLAAAAPLLRRAVDLAPDMPRPRFNAVRVLTAVANNAARAGDDSAAADALHEAETLLEAPALGLDVAELRDEVSLARISVLGQRAAAAYSRDDYSTAAARLDEALRLCALVSQPESVAADQKRYQEYRKTVCSEAAATATRRGDLAAALDWQARAQADGPLPAGESA